MARLRWLILLLGLGILFLGGAMVIRAQAPVCNSKPAISPVLDITSLPFIKNFDPCTKRLTMSDDALKATGGPYLSQAEVEKRAIGFNTPLKVRSYFVTYGQYLKMMNQKSETSTVYPDREVWLVVVQAPDQGPIPPLKPGTTPWPRRFYFGVYDATTGKVLEYGGNGPNDGDWPASLPKD